MSYNFDSQGSSKTKAQQECDEHERLSQFFRKVEPRKAVLEGTLDGIDKALENADQGYQKALLEGARSVYQGTKKSVENNMQKPDQPGNMPVDVWEDLQRRQAYKDSLIEKHGSTKWWGDGKQ